LPQSKAITPKHQSCAETNNDLPSRNRLSSEPDVFRHDQKCDERKGTKRQSRDVVSSDLEKVAQRKEVEPDDEHDSWEEQVNAIQGSQDNEG
jgi:hypothetical protein